MKTNYNNHIWDNPVLIVLAGEWDKNTPSKIIRYLGEQDSVIVMGLNCKQVSEDGSDRVFNITLSADAMNEEDALNLERAVRQTKLHRYFNKANINVCVISNESDCVKLLKFCGKLQTILGKIYYNQVILDFYQVILGKEQLSLCEISDGFSITQAKELARDATCRFIFLLSEINNEEMLVRSTEDILEMILDTVWIGNHSNARIPNTIHVFSQLEEYADNRSNVFTIGKCALTLKQEYIKKMVERVLLKELHAEELERYEGAYLKLDYLKMQVKKRVGTVKEGYEYIAFNNMWTCSNMSNIDFLFCFFGAHFYDYFNLSRQKYNIECLDITKRFCETTLKEDLQSVLYQMKSKVFDIKQIDEIVLQINNEIENEMYASLEEKDRIRAEYERWKKVIPSQKKNDILFAREILSQWLNYAEKDLYCDVLIECMRIVQNYIYSWKDNVCRRIGEIQSYIRQGRGLNGRNYEDCRSLEREIFVRYDKAISSFLTENSRLVSGLKRFAQDYIIAGKLYGTSFETFIEKVVAHISQKLDMISRKNNNHYIWRGQEVFEDILCEINQHKTFQMRGIISRAEEYCCFYGSIEKEFIQFLLAKRIQEPIYCSDFFCTEGVLYYQPIEKMEELLIFSEKSTS